MSLILRSSVIFSLSLTIIICNLSLILAVWPAPRSFSQGNQTIRLSQDFTISFPNHIPISKIPSDLRLAINQTVYQINSDRHQPLIPDRGRSLYASLVDQGRSSRDLSLSQLTLQLNYSINAGLLRSSERFSLKRGLGPSTSSSDTCPAPKIDSGGVIPSISTETRLPLEKRDESYRLVISRRDNAAPYQAVLSAPTALGIFRGLQTFSQLVYSIHAPSRDGQKLRNQAHPQNLELKEENSDQRFIYGPLEIFDLPAFPYRGFMLDTSRHFYPIEDIYRTVEVMSWAKLNFFHWHIVDAQSWPLEVTTYPELAEKAAYSSSEIYTADEVKALASYANSRGVEIMLEIDTPGHTAAIGEAYPNLVACKNAQPWVNYAAGPLAGQLRLADDVVVKFAKDIFQYAASLFPGSLLSTGGDEINKRCYEDDEVTQSSLKSKNQTLNQALNHFVTETHQVLRKAGRTPVVWEEIVLDENLNLPKDTVVAVWRNSSMVSKVAEAGYSIIHASSDFSYLDCGSGGWLGNSTDDNSWCDPFKTWQKIYSFDPYANITSSQRKQIIGGQTLLWSEQADSQNMDGLIWPRALSAAEVYWTGQERPRSVVDALPRIHDMRYRMVLRGVRATPIQPHWCALNPGFCNAPINFT
ncbi:family 20 glycoside hydrolase [Phakopsora pachyrhizi]|uniref:Beta-hexosaminidase n=2 Tax=Phakopsora pachyrhizi TaxID=170000 RepID=A0AAV0B6W3_PHAPC|nr:family 20 glycoside hydrolase [Phakopsora pachyrhizi]CAH7681249.1 family 20 glycoside hydrolase [Phakopsora pachyrhizi]